MNWRQFLKPDWRKIAIFVFIVLISSISMYIINSYYDNIAYNLMMRNIEELKKQDIEPPPSYPRYHFLVNFNTAPPILWLPIPHQITCSSVGWEGHVWKCINVGWGCEESTILTIQGINYEYPDFCLISFQSDNSSLNFSIILFYIIQFSYWYLLSCLIVCLYDKFRKKK